MRKFRTFLNQFRESRIGMIGVLILLFFLFISTFADRLSDFSIKATEGNLRDRFSPPNSKYLLGTDDVGRDILTQIMYGGNTYRTRDPLDVVDEVSHCVERYGIRRGRRKRYPGHA